MIIFDLNWVRLETCETRPTNFNVFYQLIFKDRPTLLNETGSLIGILKQILLEREMMSRSEGLTDVMQKSTDEHLVKLNVLIDLLYKEFKN